MSNRKIYRKIAKENNTTIVEVKREMQMALEYGYKNPSNSIMKAHQNQVPHKGEIPTPEEFIAYVVDKIKKE